MDWGNVYVLEGLGERGHLNFRNPYTWAVENF